MKCRIKTFSPVHIGTGEEIYPFDYVVDGEYYIRYRLEQLVEQNHTRANDLADEVEKLVSSRKGEQFNLNRFLTGDEIWLEANWEYSGFIESQTSSLIVEQLNSGYQADVFEALKTVQDELYIPGSSIKGSIRTAIAYSYFNTNREALSRVKRKVSTWQTRRGYSRRGANIGEVIEELFRNSEQVTSIHSDILKAVEVSDTQPVPTDEYLGVCAAKTVSINKRYNYKPWWSFYEVILEDRILALDISFNRNWLENNGAVQLLGWDKFLQGQKLDSNFILNCCNAFASDLIDHEIDFYRRNNSFGWESRGSRSEGRHRGELFQEPLNFYYDLRDKIQAVEDNECILRLGKGTGWTGITAVGLHLIKDSNFDRRSYRRKTGLGKADLFPKSRLLDAEKEEGEVKIYWPLGWVILSFEGD